MLSSARWVIAAWLCLGILSTAWAQLRIEITEGIRGGVPIAIVPFSGEQALPVALHEIVMADLARSGRFSVLPRGKLPATPSAVEEVDYSAWRQAGVDNLVIGRVVEVGGGRRVIEFRLVDIYRREQIAGYRVPAPDGRLRGSAHRVSDLVYEKLLGEKGAFNTRIAYVAAPTEVEPSYRLMVADADGYQPRSVLKSPEPIMSPAWSPDGQSLAYVSFEGQRARIFVQKLATGERRAVSGQQGVNGAPAWSPDGKWLALALSGERGGTNIHLLNVDNGQRRQLTDNPAIDTEPNFSPDGRSIVFTSDRGGRPQVYEMASSGGPAQRLTYEGNYNARPRFSPDGHALAMVHGQGGRYKIAVLDLGSRSLRVLTDGPLDESPSFAPNGDMIIYASQHQGKGVLSTVSFDGQVKQRLQSSGDIREAAWSPYRD